MKRKNREVSIFSMSALDLFASALGAFILITVVMFPYFPNTGMANQSDLDAALEQLQEVEADNVALQDVLSEIRQEMERRLEAERAAARREVAAARRDAEEARREVAAARRDAEEAQREVAGARRETAGLQQELDDARGRERGLERALERERRRKFLLVTISWKSRDDVDLHIVDPLGNEFYFDERTYSNSVATFEEDTILGPGNEVWLHPAVTPGEYKIYYRLYNKRTPSVTVRGSVIHSIDRDALHPQTLRHPGDKPLIATVVVDADANVEVRQ